MSDSLPLALGASLLIGGLAFGGPAFSRCTTAKAPENGVQIQGMVGPLLACEKHQEGQPKQQQQPESRQ